MTRLWGFIAAAGSLMLAALLLVIGQRDKARQAAKAAKTRTQASEATRDAERSIDKARAQARTQSAEVQREAQDRPTVERPTGNLRR